MMLGVQDSITTKVKKVVKVVEHANPVVTSGVDEEAVARVEACEKEMAEVSERVERMRKEVMEKAKEVEAKELAVRGEVEFASGEDAAVEEAVEGDEQVQIDAMKGSMTKLGNHLVNLAQTMPDKMEGLSKTIEAVTEGAVKDSDEVNEAIASSGSAEMDKSMMSNLNDSNMTEGTEGTMGEESDDDEEEDAEDMFASMVGR
jgi:hypothetical protein